MDTLLLDAANPATRVEFAMIEAEFEQRAQWRSSAASFGAVDRALIEAAAHPEVFIDAQMLRGDAVELAIRAAVADLSVRLNLAENTVRSYGLTANTLRRSLPSIWAWFREGEIHTQNAREAASIVVTLPDQLHSSFESLVIEHAKALAPSAFRAKAKAVAERLQASTLDERHMAAREERRVSSELDRDGMAWLNIYLPIEDLAKIEANVDNIAFGKLMAPDESRTMRQLRVDTMVDLLTSTGSDATVGVTVALTVPIMSLLGHSNDPAVLEGVGPIDLETARRLTMAAPSWTRLLVDPITHELITMDSKQYRPSEAMRRFLALSQVTCDFPGCGRKAKHCDLDHSVAWVEGGTTTVGNLVYRCRKHHVMKHQTRWRVTKPPGAPGATWTSPTGHVRNADPPPF